MWSYSTIDDIRKEAEIKARREGLKPCLAKIALQDVKRTGRFTRIHFLGDYTPKGWTKLKTTYLVDYSGVGEEGEPALTIPEFISKLDELSRAGEPYGVAIVEQGQFQLLIGLYKPDSRDWTRTGLLTDDELNQR